MAPRIERIVILGGGTAGWMTAAALSHVLAPRRVAITLIESEEIGTVGVGEATLPHIRFFNQRIGLDERELMAATQATMKLGIQFTDWARRGDAYIHPFGDYGQPAAGAEFQHLWARLYQSGKVSRICDYSLPIIMAEQGRFGFPAADEADVMSSFSYAYQFDAGLYARYLRRVCEDRRVTRVEGKVSRVSQDPTSGHVTALHLGEDREVSGDLYIDCSGFRALLIEGAMGSPYEDWSRWLPCDRAIAIPTENTGPLMPFTRASAKTAGWCWRIPLQHRTGNGHVYASAFLDDQAAEDELMAALAGKALRQPNRLRFRAGQRRTQWASNVVAIGLSGGFLEPLESTSIHLIQQGITTLMELFPDGGPDPADIAEFNRVMSLEYDRVRDFLILHYHATERDDSEFWNHVRTMDVPGSLDEKLTLFRERGLVMKYRDGLFLNPSWISVFIGQRVIPRQWDPRAEAVPADQAAATLARLKRHIAETVERLPSHESALAAYCPAKADA
ncbi:tryptophan halogenase family protein [Hyphomonas sp.]|uniref:tryptophan halogenase family protein n=1 Tax=Hyphomonas sp. TaxID=87 RepID=UPI003918C3F1